MTMLPNDLRYAVRTLRKAPVFTAAAFLTLALGIGANTAIFSVVNAVILRPLPFAQPDRLVQVAEKNDKLNLQFFGASVLNYLSWKEQTRTLDLAVIGFASFNLTGRGDPEQYTGYTVSPSLLPVLGIQPVIGRGFREGEDKPGSPPVAMLSEGLWKRRFGADPAIVGQDVAMNGAHYTVVGIAPAALTVLTPGDVWVPQIIDPGREARLNHLVQVVGRLKPGVTMQQAQNEMITIVTRVARQFPEIKDWGVQLRLVYQWLVPGDLRTALAVLLAAVGLVMLIACANVANLLLSRAASRQKEMAVRSALGAGRGRLLRQLLTESVALAALGGAGGLAAASFAVGIINTSLPAGLLPVPDISIDGPVLLFALAITLATGLVFGLAPAWHSARTDLNTVIKQGGRSSSGGARPWVRNGLVAGQLALATMLLIGAGLLIESLMHLQQVRLGFRADGLLTFQLSLPQAKYAGPATNWAFYRELLASLETLPGVKGAAISSGIPFGNGNTTRTPTAAVGKSVLPVGTAIAVGWRSVSPGYFRALEIPLVRGRYFTDQDDPSAPAVASSVAIVSQTMASNFWGSDDPLGRTIRVVGSGREFQVVGVVGDAHNANLNQDPLPAMYFPAAVRLFPLTDVVVRTAGAPEGQLAGVRKKVHDLDPELAVSTVRTMEQWVAASTAQPRLNAVLLAIFASVALLIAAIGIYGVLSYSVSQRTREIGLRMAMGAQRSVVTRMVVREGMLVALAGIAAGVAGALAVSRALAVLLFGVQARDPATFAAVTAALAVVALAACYVPARRAAGVDPIVALRDE